MPHQTLLCIFLSPAQKRKKKREKEEKEKVVLSFPAEIATAVFWAAQIL